MTMIKTPPINLNIIVTQKNGNPAIELRRCTTDPEIIRNIIYSAIKKTPVVIYPKFNDNIRAINSLVEKGILYYNKDSEDYFFNI